MAPNVSMKVDLPADHKGNPTGNALVSGKTLRNLPDADAKSLVSGGFADELDARGYVVDQSVPDVAPVVTKADKAAAKAAAAEAEEDAAEPKKAAKHKGK